MGVMKLATCSVIRPVLSICVMKLLTRSCVCLVLSLSTSV